jgi:hypothetical protein
MAFTHSFGWQPPSGCTLKAIGSGGRYGALAVRFTNRSNPERDLQLEFFTEDTEFSRTDNGRVATMFNHGIAISDEAAIFKKFADAVFQDAELKRLDNGIFGTITLDPADALQSALADLIEQGALRFSSGSTAQFVRRGPDGQILRWPIVELSITPTPAEWRLPKLRRI